MSDRPAPRVPRANPAPRRALPRVTPLSAGGTQPAAPSPVVPDEAAEEAAEEATGRDLLIPNGSQQARRKGRGAAPVPTLAELMPPPGQHRKKSHAHNEPGGPASRTGLDAAQKHGPGKGKDRDKDKDRDSKDDKDSKEKEVDLQVTLSKGLRKRLKAKSAEIGLSPEQAVAQLVEVWVDG